MKRYEEITETVTRKRLVERCCDLCGMSAVDNDWGAPRFRVDETEIQVTVSCRQGSEYPEGGCGWKYEIDLCPKCFKTRLMPWLESQGADVKEMEWEW